MNNTAKRQHRESLPEGSVSVAIPSSLSFSKLSSNLFHFRVVGLGKLLHFLKMRIVLVGIIMNVISTVGVVLGNKHLYSKYEFHFMIFLSCLHFITTSIATRILLWVGFFDFKPAKFHEVLPVALGSLGSVAFMNLNLAHNTVGFYQVSKLMCIPVTMTLQYMLFSKKSSRKVQMSLVVILIGVGVATVSDISVNRTGLLFAIAAVLCTALGQIFTGSKQKELGLDPMQLLYHASPIIAVGMVPLALVFDDIGNLSSYPLSIPSLSWAILTCFLAVGVNMSNYIVIGKTSAVTYQVVGHSKTCLILILGYLFFESPFSYKVAFGVAIALTGVVWYGDIKRREASHQAYEPVAKSAEMKETSHT